MTGAGTRCLGDSVGAGRSGFFVFSFFTHLLEFLCCSDTPLLVGGISTSFVRIKSVVSSKCRVQRNVGVIVRVRPEARCDVFSVHPINNHTRETFYQIVAENKRVRGKERQQLCSEAGIDLLVGGRLGAGVSLILRPIPPRIECIPRGGGSLCSRLSLRRLPSIHRLVWTRSRRASSRRSLLKLALRGDLCLQEQVEGARLGAARVVVHPVR